MNNKKNIDRLFQEKFKDFEMAPNDAVWDRISESLPNKKKKRRVLVLWWQIGGVAAVIALLLTVGVSVFNSNNGDNQNLPIVNVEDEDKDTNLKNGNKKNSEDTPEAFNTDIIEKIELVETVKSEEKKHVNEKKHDTASQKKSFSNSSNLTTSQNTKTYSVANTTKEKDDFSEKLDELKSFKDRSTNSKVAYNSKEQKAISNEINDDKVLSKSEIKSEIQKKIENSKTAVVDNNSQSETLSKEGDLSENTVTDISLKEDKEKQSIKEAIAENTETIDEKEEDKQNRWSIAPNVAPVYYSSLGQGSSLDQQFNNNSKSSAINMSYGITGSYVISKKLKIRAGINRVNLSQTTSDVFAFSGSETAARGISSNGNIEQQAQESVGNINFNSGNSVLLMSSTMLDASSVPEQFNTKIAGDIDQRFGFVEVPLELQYSLLDKKFGVNVIGGFSTFFLNENEIYADVEGVSTLVGEANNINNTSFSANFGLGLDYDLSKQWNINLEPQFKYQINTFNNATGDFRPFFIGVYTGLSFKF